MSRRVRSAPWTSLRGKRCGWCKGRVPAILSKSESCERSRVRAAKNLAFRFCGGCGGFGGKFDLVGFEGFAFRRGVNHHAVANREIGRLGGFVFVSDAGNIQGGGEELYFHRLAVGRSNGHGIGVDFFQRAYYMLFVAMSHRETYREQE